VTPPRRESDRLLERLRTLVRDGRNTSGVSSVAPEARRPEIERFKAKAADVAQRTTALTSNDREVRE
jgi:hypothetical protein